jgi:hypothetical protein
MPSKVAAGCPTLSLPGWEASTLAACVHVCGSQQQYDVAVVVPLPVVARKAVAVVFVPVPLAHSRFGGSVCSGFTGCLSVFLACRCAMPCGKMYGQLSYMPSTDGFIVMSSFGSGA